MCGETDFRTRFGVFHGPEEDREARLTAAGGCSAPASPAPATCPAAFGEASHYDQHGKLCARWDNGRLRGTPKRRALTVGRVSADGPDRTHGRGGGDGLIFLALSVLKTSSVGRVSAMPKSTRVSGSDAEGDSRL